MTPAEHGGSNGAKGSAIPSALEMTMVPPARAHSQPLAVALAPTAQPLPHVPGNAPSEPPGLAAAPSFAALFQAVRRRWFLALLCGTLGAALAVAAVFFVMPPKYIPVATLQVDSKGDGGLLNFRQESPEFVIFKANLPALIKSPLVLSAALNQTVAPGKFARDLSIVRERGPGAVDWLEKAIKTDYNLGPEILKVTLAAERGDEAADLLNAVLLAFLQEQEQGEKNRSSKRIEDLQKNQLDLEQELSRLRTQLAKRETAAGLTDPLQQTRKYELAIARLGAAEKEQLQNRLNKIGAEQELNALNDRQKNIDAVSAPEDQLDAFLRDDPQAGGVFADMVKAERNYNEAKRVAANANPQSLKPFLDKLDGAKRAVAQRREELRPELEKRWRTKFVDDLKLAALAVGDKLVTLSKQQTILNELVSEAGAEVAKVAPGNQNVPLDIVNLRDKVASMQKGIDKISEEATIIRANPGKTRVALLQRATEPQEKDASRQTKMAAAGGLGMFAFALVGVGFLEFRRRKINRADDVRHGLGLHVVGTVPPMPDSARRPSPNGASQADLYWQNRLMESIDGIRTMLLHAARGDSLRIIMVTSAVGGEGKTSLASQLAASLARAWKKTLLIDGDLRHPAAHRLFGAPLDPGFSEVLRGDADLVQAIKATAVSRLWVMPAGHWDAHAVQALAQDQVRTMFQTLKQQYDFVIVDSCPVLPVADALLLGQHVDGVLFSVMRDVSRLPSLHAAQQRLQNLGVRTLGAVVIGEQSDLAAEAYKYAMATRS